MLANAKAGEVEEQFDSVRIASILGLTPRVSFVLNFLGKGLKLTKPQWQQFMIDKKIV